MEWRYCVHCVFVFVCGVIYCGGYSKVCNSGVWVSFDMYCIASEIVCGCLFHLVQLLICECKSFVAYFVSAGALCIGVHYRGRLVGNLL